jgi:hypothetical protein
MTEMKKPHRVLTDQADRYPDLEQFAVDRRAFLRKLAIGAVGLGVGGRILAACTSTTGISGTAQTPELYEVRLPGSGFSGAYLRYDDYLEYAVVITTYSEQLASFYRSTESIGLDAVSAVLSVYQCHELEDMALRPSIRAELVDALSGRYREEGGDPLSEVHTLQLLIESCEYVGAMDGGMSLPMWP